MSTIFFSIATFLFLLFLSLLVTPLEHDPPHDFIDEHPPSNSRLEKAYVALPAWKHVITEDPTNLTIHRCGPHVCNYTGVFCTATLNDPYEITVAGIDLNGGQITGELPEELDLSLFHINSNHFVDRLREALRKMERLFELDVNNNVLDNLSEILEIQLN